MKIEISEKELTAIMAANFCLGKSKEIKHGGTYVSSIQDYENCRKISFCEADSVLYDFVERIFEELKNENN